MTTSVFRFGMALGTALLASTVLSSAAFAEATISVYGGANFSPHSSVDYDLNDGNGPQSATQEWAGKSFEAPPYYGVRATWWLNDMPEWGVAIDFTHAKVYSEQTGGVSPGGFTKLEFTDGINFLTANGLYRWKQDNGFTPYVGAGLGLSIPHVEVGHPNLPSQTMEYQVTGVAAQIFAGVDYKLTDNWSVYGELKSNYGVVDADLDGGGYLETDIISNQVIFGVTYKFW